VAGSPQEQWLRQDLAANPAPCTIGMWHHARWSSGSEHGNDPATQAFWQAMYEAGAEMVLVGHDHDYERFAPMDAAGNVDETYGIRQIVVGTGGIGLYALGTTAANSVARNDTTHGVLKLKLREAGYDFDFVPIPGGTFTDSGTGTCHGAPPAQPGATEAFADGFESGDFGAWTSVTKAGDGAATVQTALVKAGADAARLSATTSGAYAYARHRTAAPLTAITATGWFNQRAEGPSGANVPLLRLYDEQGTRIVSLYRQNQVGGAIYANYNGGYFKTTGTLALNTWAQFSLTVRIGATGGVVEIRQNGTLTHRTTTANLGTQPIRILQIGNNTAGQPFDVVVDEITASDASIGGG
jgi:hypothetical protein